RRACDGANPHNRPFTIVPSESRSFLRPHRLKVGLMDNKKLRVVVADDHPMWLLMLASILGANCEVVATAADGKSALQYVSRFDPDVVVLDLCMPGLSGLEVTRELMSNGPRPAVVICSAHVMPDII